jgi:hypothetical protein
MAVLNMEQAGSARGFITVQQTQFAGCGRQLGVGFSNPQVFRADSDLVG